MITVFKLGVWRPKGPEHKEVIWNRSSTLLVSFDIKQEDFFAGHYSNLASPIFYGFVGFSR